MSATVLFQIKDMIDKLDSRSLDSTERFHTVYITEPPPNIALDTCLTLIACYINYLLLNRVFGGSISLQLCYAVALTLIVAYNIKYLLLKKFIESNKNPPAFIIMYTFIFAIIGAPLFTYLVLKKYYGESQITFKNMAIIVLCYGLAYLFVYPLTTLRRKSSNENMLMQDNKEKSIADIAPPQVVGEQK